MLAPRQAAANLEDRLDRPGIDMISSCVSTSGESSRKIWLMRCRVDREHQDVDHRPVALRQHPHHVEAAEVRAQHDRAALRLGEPVERLEAVDFEFEVLRLPNQIERRSTIESAKVR